jgi:enoyl-CoA hydratase
LNEGLEVSVRDRVAYLTLNRPERLNALSIGLMAQLAEVLTELDDNEDVWALTITGTGDRAFCAGVDLKELEERARTTGQGPLEPMRGVERNLFEVVLELEKPTLAVLNGPAVGAGCELALACDLRLAADHAHFGLPEAKRGMGATFGSVILPRLLPRAIALEMLYTGEPLAPEVAAGFGLINRVVPRAELPDEAERLIRSIVANAPLTLRRYKQMITKGWELPVHSALRLNAGPNVYRSRDREEGVRAFVEKRAPRWEGR